MTTTTPATCHYDRTLQLRVTRQHRDDCPTHQDGDCPAAGAGCAPAPHPTAPTATTATPPTTTP